MTYDGEILERATVQVKPIRSSATLACQKLALIPINQSSSLNMTFESHLEIIKEDLTGEKSQMVLNWNIGLIVLYLVIVLPILQLKIY